MTQAFAISRFLTALMLAGCIDSGLRNQAEPALDESSRSYLGQELPGDVPIKFATGLVTTELMNHSTPVFSSDGKEVFWSTFVDKPKVLGTIYTARFEDGEWTKQEVAPFHDEIAGEDNPFFSPDGSKLFFTSRREMPYEDSGSRENIWYCDRTRDGWSIAAPLSKVINDRQLHWQISVNNAGDLFYSSDDGVMISRRVNGEYQEPRSMRESFGQKYIGDLAYINPQETLILFTSDQIKGGVGKNDIYVGFKLDDNSWSAPVNIGSKINSESQDTFPTLTPDGKYMFFLSSRDKHFDVYWVDAGFIAELRKEVIGS